MQKLFQLGLQHVNVGIQYHDETRIRAMTLTALEKKMSFPQHIKLKHDVDQKVQQLKELALKSGRYGDLVCDCEVCLKL